MAIDSVSSKEPVRPPPKAAPVEATEAVRGGKNLKNVGDADGAGAAGTTSKSSAPKPTSNALGQTIGGTLNVTA